MAANVDNALAALLRSLKPAVATLNDGSLLEASTYNGARSPQFQRSGSARFDSTNSDFSSRKSPSSRLTSPSFPKQLDEFTNASRTREFVIHSPTNSSNLPMYQTSDVRFSPVSPSPSSSLQRSLTSFRNASHSFRARGSVSFREDASTKKDEGRRIRNQLDEQEQRMNDIIQQRQYRRVRSGQQSMKSSRAASPEPVTTPLHKNGKEDALFLNGPSQGDTSAPARKEIQNLHTLHLDASISPNSATVNHESNEDTIKRTAKNSYPTSNEEELVRPSLAQRTKSGRFRRQNAGNSMDEEDDIPVRSARQVKITFPQLDHPLKENLSRIPSNNGDDEVVIQAVRNNSMRSFVLRRPSDGSSMKSPPDSSHDASENSSVRSITIHENDYRPSRRGTLDNEKRDLLSLKTPHKAESTEDTWSNAQSPQSHQNSQMLSSKEHITFINNPNEGLASSSLPMMEAIYSKVMKPRSNSLKMKNQTSKDMIDSAMLRRPTQIPIGDLKVNPPTASVRLINETSKIWFQPQFTRSEANQYLLKKPPGAFVIRRSTSKKDAYGLAFKVEKLPKYSPEFDATDPNNFIRHFLIETSRQGVRLMGSETEPYFPSLTALIYQHCLTPLSLPCILRMEAIAADGDKASTPIDGNLVMTPTSSLTTSSIGNGADRLNMRADSPSTGAKPTTIKGQFLYLANVNVENMCGWAALDKTLSSILQQIGNVRQTECSLWVAPDGVTLTDKWRKLFFRQHFPASSVAYCEMDRRGRTWNSPELQSRGVTSAKLFGLIIRMRPQGNPSHNQCIVLCECSSEQPAKPFVDAIFKLILAHS